MGAAPIFSDVCCVKSFLQRPQAYSALPHCVFVSWGLNGALLRAFTLTHCQAVSVLQVQLSSFSDPNAAGGVNTYLGGLSSATASASGKWNHPPSHYIIHENSS